MDLKPDARRMLSLANAARAPSPEDKARVERKLAAAIGAAGGAGAALASAEALARSAAAVKPAAGYGLKLWIAGALLASAVGTGYVLQSTPPRARPSHAARAPVPAAAPRTVEHTPATSSPLPPPAAPAQRAHPGRAHASGPSELDDLALLQRAQRAWREGSAQRALALLAQHRRAYPASQLALERDALRVLALCQLGQHAEARTLARALFARAPEAPMRASIEQSCALK